MTQTIRPTSNITQTNYTGGYAETDETSASDADWAYCTDNNGGTLEMKFGTPPAIPGGGLSTLRYRLAKCSTITGAPTSSGVDPNCAVAIYQGASLIASGTSAAVTNADIWTTFSDDLDLTAVTDWTDVRVRIVSTGAGRPQTGISWVELEVPNPSSGIWFE